MANLTKEQVMEELTALGVQYDPELDYNELRKLLKESKMDTSSEGDNGEKNPLTPPAGSEKMVPSQGPQPASRTVLNNVKHNGTLYAKGSQVDVNDDNFEALEAGGFLVPLE